MDHFGYKVAEKFLFKSKI